MFTSQENSGKVNKMVNNVDIVCLNVVNVDIILNYFFSYKLILVVKKIIIHQ